MKIKAQGESIKRQADFLCPKCGMRNVGWVNIKPTTEFELLCGQVVTSCLYCEVQIRIEEDE